MGTSRSFGSPRDAANSVLQEIRLAHSVAAKKRAATKALREEGDDVMPIDPPVGDRYTTLTSALGLGPGGSSAPLFAKLRCPGRGSAVNSESPYLIAFILVSWFLGLCAVFDVLSQPKAAFRSAGHSKLLWLGVEVVGTLLSYTGIITWLLYSIWIRPSLVRAGGRRRKKGAFFGRMLGAWATPAAQSTSSVRSSPGSNWAKPTTNNTIGSKPVERCGSCSGSGKESCFACQGRGRITIPAYAPHAGTSDGWCTPCGSSGKIRCSSCGGSGKRS